MATPAESMAESEWYASRTTPPPSLATATRQGTQPDTLDPFAPLWALRNKSRSASMDGGQRRPWMVEASSSPWPSPAPGSPLLSSSGGSASSQNPPAVVYAEPTPPARVASPPLSFMSTSSKQGRPQLLARRPSTAMGVIRSTLPADQRNLVDGSLYAKAPMSSRYTDDPPKPPPKSKTPVSPSSSRMSYISRQSASPTRSLESPVSRHRGFPTSIAPPVVTKAATEGSTRYPSPNPLDPFAPLSALRSMSLDGRKRPTWAIEAGSPVSPASSAFSSLPRTPPSSDGACSMQRVSTASSAPTPFRSPVSTPASSFKRGYHRPAVARPRTMETCHSSMWASSSNTVVLPDEVGNLQPPSTATGASSILLSTDSHAIIQDQREAPVVGSNDQPSPKLKRNRLSKLFLGLRRPNTSSGVAVDKENANRGTALSFRPFQRVRTLSLQPTSASHLNGNYNNLIQHQKAHSSDHHQRRASLAKATISPPVVSTAVWQSQMTGRQCLPITASPLLNTAISVQPETQDQLLPQQAAENAPLDTLVNDASIRHGRLIGNDESALDTNSRSPSNQASLPSSSPPRLTFTGAMQDDSGVELQRPLDGQRIRGVSVSITGVGSAASASRPHGPRKPASMKLAPIQTRTSQSTSSSSYIEVFTTPSASPMEDSFQARVSPITPPSNIQRSSAPSQDRPLNSALLAPPPLMSASIPTPQSASSTKAQCLCSTTVSVPHPPQTEWALPTQPQLAYAASLPIYQSDGTPLQFGTVFAEHRAIVLFLRHFFCPMCQDYVSSLSSLVKQPMLRELGALADFDEDDARAFLSDPENGELLPKQVQLVLISCGKATLVDKYKHMFGLPFRMFTDPEMKVYNALGMGRMGKMGGMDGVSGVGEGDGSRTRDEGPLASPTAGTTGHGSQHCEWHDGELIRSPSSVGSSASGSSSTTTDSQNRGRRGGYVKHGLMGGIAMVVMRAVKVGMPIWENGGDIAQLGGEFVLGPGLTCSFAHRMQNAKGHAPVVDVLSAANVKIPEEVLEAPSPSSPHKARKLKSKSQERSPKGKENAAGRAFYRDTKSLPTTGGGRSSSLDTRRDSKEMPDSDTLMGNGVPLVQKRKRESFVTATLRSMGENVPPGFRGVTPHTIGEDSLSVVSEDTTHEHWSDSYPRVKGFYADTEFIPYSGSPPPRPESHLDREQTWMDFRQKDLETLRQRKDARRRTGKTSSVSESLTIPSSPGPRVAVKLNGANDQRESFHVTQASINESVSVDLSQLEFGPGSTEDLHAKAGGSSGESSTSTTKSLQAKGPVLPTFKDDLDDFDEMDLSGVVAVGGFIQVPRNPPRRGAAGLGKLPKSVQAAIDLDLQMGARARDMEKSATISNRNMRKGGRERSFSASVMNLFRGSQ